MKNHIICLHQSRERCEHSGERIVFLKDVYKCESKYFLAGELSIDRVKRVFDLILSFQNINESEELIYRDVEETDDTFVYSYCSYLVSYGDYEAKDSVVLKKQAITLDKATREYIFSNPITIREVEVEDYIFGW
ncbi:MAG TPA: hypothetical protein GX705_04785 [Clostridiales bacterium]|nr:hypothetical protein [Clostridiales bacterium]